MSSDSWILAFVIAELVVLALLWAGERRHRGGHLVVGVVAAAITAAGTLALR